MVDRPALGDEVVLETGRLRLRRWRAAEATILRELWAERDPRVPERRRIDPAGRPTVADLAEAISSDQPWSAGLLAVERRAEGDVIGYCGLVDGDRERGPELAFELLRRTWGRGYATEAAGAVLDRARSAGHDRLWACVWEWNAASLRVLAKLGFAEVAREETAHGTNVVTSRAL